LIIESHDHAKVVIAQSALISNFVALLSEGIAEATENNRRNSGYAEISQTS
jgi:hypothetical protein